MNIEFNFMNYFSLLWYIHLFYLQEHLEWKYWYELFNSKQRCLTFFPAEADDMTLLI